MSKFNPLLPVRRRDGLRAGIYEVCSDRINGWYQTGDSLDKRMCVWALDGSFTLSPDPRDLVNIPEEPQKAVRYVNIYPDGPGPILYLSNIDARTHAEHQEKNGIRGGKVLARARVIIEYKSGVFDP